MRNLALLPLLALLAAPVAARADLTLRSALGAGDARPARLVPPLALGAPALDAGSGGGKGGTEPVLALVLGIFPGFGLGHYVAGAPWQKWAVIDVVILVAAIAVTAADLGLLEALAWIAVVVERVIEGLDAYGKAGGKLGASSPPRSAAVALGPGGPVRDAADPGPARPPEVVLARF